MCWLKATAERYSRVVYKVACFYITGVGLLWWKMEMMQVVKRIHLFVDQALGHPNDLMHG